MPIILFAILVWDIFSNTPLSKFDYTYSPVDPVATWTQAAGELVAIIYNSGTNSGNHTEFSYDGAGRRTQVVERSGTTYGSGTVSATKNYLWVGLAMAEERNASNTVTKRFFAQGEEQSTTPYFYTYDAPGSVREMMDGSGSLVSRLDYDAYGRTSVVSGTSLPLMQYKGGANLEVNLQFFVNVIYSANTGRTLNESGGASPSGFGGNNPVVTPGSFLPPVPSPGIEASAPSQGPSQGQFCSESSPGKLPPIVKKVIDDAVKNLKTAGKTSTKIAVGAILLPDLLPEIIIDDAAAEGEPLVAGELTTYEDAAARSVPGDNLAAHELWQNASLEDSGLASGRLSTPASQQNPVIMLDPVTHSMVNTAQSVLNTSAMAPIENITTNAQILRTLNVADPEVINAAEQAALKHAGDYGY